MNLTEHFLSEKRPVFIGGRRYLLCRVCNQIKSIEDFWTYGGPFSVNVGECTVCLELPDRVSRSSYLRTRLRAKALSEALYKHKDNRDLVRSMSHYLKYPLSNISEDIVDLLAIVEAEMRYKCHIKI